MAFIRNCMFIAVLFCCYHQGKAQTVYYPATSSQLLKATAEDMALLLQKATGGPAIRVEAYTAMPATGIVFMYDSSQQDNQACKVEGNGNNFLKFTAAQDNGLCYGVYQYLQVCGFRFYQPGSIWERVPSMESIYKKTDTLFTNAYKYRTWFVSGGYRRWAMDNNNDYGWDLYAGEQGHNWALYQRRNGMLGAYRFTGHRGDMMSGDYLAGLQQNNCYVACFNGSRAASNRSVPDINNTAAMQWWSKTIEQKFTQGQAVINNNPNLYLNQYRNSRYGAANLGIETPDGSNWANSKDASGCNAADYLPEADQHMLLSNFTAQDIGSKYPNLHYQVYAYATHADVPSKNIAVNSNIDVQLIPAVYQRETSTNGIRNRWFSRHQNMSEYHYLNLSAWSGETPSFKWSELKATLQLAKDKKSQGLVWEASPAKFGSLPFLLAANNQLKDGTAVDSTLRAFCDDMFAGAANSVYELLQQWGSDDAAPSKYKMNRYLQLVQQAAQLTGDEGEPVKQRIRELKAYLHYMLLYFNADADVRQKESTESRDAKMCLYLARISRLQLVNSYYLIICRTNAYPATSNFYTLYNVFTGTAYQNGALLPITGEEIDNDFENDVVRYGNTIPQYALKENDFIKGRFDKSNILPLQKIKTSIGYTNGIYNYNAAVFHIDAPAKGSFEIQCTPRFDEAGKGYLNFLLEGTGTRLEVWKDFTLDKTAGSTNIKINLPAAGTYKLTITSKYKTAADLVINTNNNYFYRRGSFLGSKTESYKADPASLPGYFYVPAGLRRVYFEIPNNLVSGKYAAIDAISSTFNIKDNKGNLVKARLANATDSSLFYMEVAPGTDNSFWQATSMEQYNLAFVNISNLLWYATRKNCSVPAFSIGLVEKKGICYLQLKASGAVAEPRWEIAGATDTLRFDNRQLVEIPASLSINTLITLTNKEGCSTGKVLKDEPGYLQGLRNCALGGALPETGAKPAFYPNPSTGIYNCSSNGQPQTADEVWISDAQGMQKARFANSTRLDISNLAAGVYWYRLRINGEIHTGKLVKQ